MKFLALTLGVAFLAAPGFADYSTKFVYNGTPTSTGHTASLEADFLVQGGNLLVTLYNTTANLTYDTQVLTGVLFKYSGTTSGTTAGTLTNPNVQLYNISDTNGKLTATGNPASANWRTETGDLSGYVTLTNLNNGNSGGSHGLISTNTNTAGTNNLSNHNSFVEGPLQFTIGGLNLTSSSQITAVRFNLGTAIGTMTDDVTAVLIATPEPETYGFAVGALLCIVGVSRRKKITRER